MKQFVFASILAVIPCLGHPGHGVIELYSTNHELSSLSSSSPLASLPPRLSAQFSKGGRQQTLVLRQSKVRSPHFCVRLDSGHDVVQFLPDDGKIHTYLGHLENDLGSMVSAWIDERGIEAEIYQSNGRCWVVRPPKKPSEDHLIYDLETDATRPLVDQLNIMQHQILAALKKSSSLHQALALPKSVTVKKAEIGFDVSNKTFRQEFKGKKRESDFTKSQDYGYGFDEDPELAKRYILSFLNTMNGIYMRDALIKFELGVLNIRMDAKSCPYEKETIIPASLNLFRDVWNGQNRRFGSPPSETHHLAHAMIGNKGGAAGYAWVGTVAEDSCYSIGGTSIGTGLNFWKGIAMHEILHTWGGNHGDGKDMEFSISGGAYSVGMSPGNRHRMNPVEQRTALKERDSSDLPDIGAIPDSEREISPYGGFDEFTAHEGGPTITLDVLVNDHDANNSRFEISHCALHKSGNKAAVNPATESRLGGQLEIAPGEGPGGRDLLRYTPPLIGSGTDQFIYILKDETGREGMGTVKITLKGQEPGITLADGSLTSFQFDDKATFGPGFYSAAQLNRTAVRSKSASSLKVPLNHEVTLYAKDGEDLSSGHAVCGPGAHQLSNIPFLDETGQRIGINAQRRVSALKVTFTGPDRPHVIVCSEPSFKGARALFNGMEATGLRGAYPAVFMDWAGIPEKNIASIHIPKGYQVTVFTKDHFKGEKTVLTESIKDLRELGLADKISSLQIVYQPETE